MTYLGTIVSYQQFENQTLRHRLQLANIAFQRISKWITGRRGLKIADRFALWKTCVLPIATYGIFSMGVTVQGLLQLQQRFYVMIRQLLRDHAYRTGRTHSEALQRHNIPAPLQLLWQVSDRFLQSATHRYLQLDNDDLARTVPWTSLIEAQERIHALQLSGTVSDSCAVPASDQVQLSIYHCCPHCDFFSEHATALRRHCTVAHAQPIYRTKPSIPSMHMNAGLPICKHCNVTFSTWKSFTVHLQRGCPFHPSHDALRTCQAIMDQPMTAPEFPARRGHADDAMRGTVRISQADLDSLMQQEWGHRLLRIIGHRQWTQIGTERTMVDFLAKQCCLCNQWIGRAQEMHRHIELCHPQYWEHVLLKSTQFSNMYADEAPCDYCGQVFKSGHKCNVWTQISMLLLYGAGQTVASIAPTDARHCEICNLRLPSLEAMHRHLIEEHQLPTARWNPSRDSLDGHPACAHCGMVFGGMESLRSHIAQSRCQHFDPSRTSEPKEVDPRWQYALCQGALLETLRVPHNRLQLTLHCQCCQKRCSRAADLMLHLQSAHSQVWAASEAVTLLLVGMFYQLLGCQCNSCTTTKRLNHICVPFRQLAMQLTRMTSTDVLMPLTLRESDLLKTYATSLPADLKFGLDQVLVNRDLDSIWHNPALLTQLSSRCILCNKECHPTELGLHLRQVHGCSTLLVSFYVQQLLPLMLRHMELDHKCYGCGMIFNTVADQELPDPAARTFLVRAHLKAQCPCLLQLAIALSLAHNGGRLGHEEPGRCAESNPADIPASRHVLRQRSPTGTEPQTSEEGQKRRRTQGQGATGRSRAQHRQSPTTDGPPGDSTGSRDSGTTQGRHLPLLFQQQRASRRPEEFGPSSQHLEGADTTAQTAAPVDLSTTDPVSSAAEGSDRQAQRTGDRRTNVGTATGSSEEQCTPGRHDLSLLGMGRTSEDVEGESEAPHHSEEDGGKHHGALGRLQGSVANQEVSRTATISTEHGDTLAASGQYQSGSGVPLAPLSVPQRDLAPAWHEHEATQPVPKQHGYAVGDCPEPAQAEGTIEGPPQGSPEEPIEELSPGDPAAHGNDTDTLTCSFAPLDRPSMQRVLSHAILANPGNWCYANSTVISMLWTTLATSTFETAVWGYHSKALETFLCSLHDQEGHLAQTSWFQEVLQCWGIADSQQMGRFSQHDAAEFVSAWLETMRSPAFNMSWERRVDDKAVIKCVDHCAHTIPLFLQFDAFHLQLSSFSVNSLIDIWRQVDGMVAALTCMPTCVCIHIDRCVMVPPHNSIAKCDAVLNLESDCVLPVFLNDTLSGLSRVHPHGAPSTPRCGPGWTLQNSDSHSSHDTCGCQACQLATVR